jgi:hypothetical protein
MENSAATDLANRCLNIRWKGMLIDAEGDPTATSLSGDHVCWCLLTQTCLGPDGQVVGEDVCNFARSCYAAM